MRHPARPHRLSFAAGILAGLLLSLSGLWLAIGPAPGERLPLPAPIADSTDPPPAQVRILVLGVDERAKDPGRSDTMLLVQAGGGAPVRILSIPRDTKVAIGGHSASKINAAYTYGGPEMAKEAVRGLLGLPVDYYVKVNMAGFRRLVDLMGGVTIDVPAPMHYRDPDDDLVIDLDPGVQRLSGDKAEQFVRFRHDAIGDDMGRVGRQQTFLKALASEALTPANLPRVPQLVYTASKYVETDLPAAEQLRLAGAIFSLGRQDGLITETLPGHGGYEDGISFYFPDPVQVRRLASLWRPGPDATP